METSKDIVAQAQFARRLMEAAEYSEYTHHGHRDGVSKADGLDWLISDRVAHVLERTRNEAAVLRVLIGFARDPLIDSGEMTEEILAEAERVLSEGWEESDRYRIVGMFSDNEGCGEDTAGRILRAAYYSLMGCKGNNRPRVFPASEDRSCGHLGIRDAAIKVVRTAYLGVKLELGVERRALGLDRDRIWETTLKFVVRLDEALQQVRPLPALDAEKAA